jgi:hypothetical protein
MAAIRERITVKWNEMTVISLTSLCTAAMNKSGSQRMRNLKLEVVPESDLKMDCNNYMEGRWVPCHHSSPEETSYLMPTNFDKIVSDTSGFFNG